MSLEPGEDTEDANSSGEVGRMGEPINKKLSFTKEFPPTPRAGLYKQKCGEPLQVFLRVRPLSQEDTDSHECIVPFEDSVELNAPLDSAAAKNGEMKSRLTFSTVFGPEATQQEVYQATASPLVEAMVEGQNGLLFAYGITNSGKTFTIQGKEGGNEGIIPRVVTSLFALLDKAPSARFVTMSFVEIYNEKIFDLLDASSKGHNKKACNLRNTAHDRVVVVGAKEMLVSTVHEAMGVVQQGIANRCVGHTMLNADSSRSHSVFTITLLAEDRTTVWSRLSVCDLAGAERLKRAEHNTGKGIKEATNINLSLMVLSRCLDILRKNQSIADPLKKQVVPFRDSVLTRLFRDSLMGWGRTVMIANANPQAHDFDETLHILKYAALARDISIQPRVDTRRQPIINTLVIHETNEDDPMPEGMNSDNEDEVMDMYLDQIYHLKTALVEAEMRQAMTEKNVRAEVCNETESQLAKYEQAWSQSLEKEKIRLSKMYEGKLKVLQYGLQSSAQGDEKSRLDMALITEEKMHQTALERMQAEHKLEVLEMERKFKELEQSTKQLQDRASSPIHAPKAEPDESVLSQLAVLENKVIEAATAFHNKQKAQISKRSAVEAQLLEELAKSRSEKKALHEEQAKLRAENLAQSEEQENLRIECTALTEQNQQLQTEQAKLQTEKLALAEQNKTLSEESKLYAEKSTISEQYKKEYAKLQTEKSTLIEQHKKEQAKLQAEKLALAEDNKKQQALLQEEKSNLLARNKELTEEQAALQEAHTALSKQMKELEEKQASIRTETLTLKEQNHKLSEEFTTLQSSNLALIEKYKKLNEERTAWETEKVLLQEQIKEAQVKSQDEMVVLVEQNKKLNEEQKKASEEQKKLHVANAQLLEQNKHLNEEKTKLLTENSILLEQSKKLNDEIPSVVNTTKMEVRQLEQVITRLQSELNELNKTHQIELSEAKNTSKMLQSELTEAKNASKSLQNEIIETKSVQKSLQIELAETKSAHKTLQNEFTEVKSSKKALQTELAEAKSKNKALEDELAEAKSDDTELQNQLAEAKSSTKDLEMILQETEKEIAQLKSEAKESSKHLARIKDLEVEIRNLTKAKADLEEKLEDTNKMLTDTIDDVCNGKPLKCASCRKNEQQAKRTKPLTLKDPEKTFAQLGSPRPPPPPPPSSSLKRGKSVGNNKETPQGKARMSGGEEKMAVVKEVTEMGQSVIVDKEKEHIELKERDSEECKKVLVAKSSNNDPRQVEALNLEHSRHITPFKPGKFAFEKSPAATPPTTKRPKSAPLTPAPPTPVPVATTATTTVPPSAPTVAKAVVVALNDENKPPETNIFVGSNSKSVAAKESHRHSSKSAKVVVDHVIVEEGEFESETIKDRNEGNSVLHGKSKRSSTSVLDEVVEEHKPGRTKKTGRVKKVATKKFAQSDSEDELPKTKTLLKRKSPETKTREASAFAGEVVAPEELDRKIVEPELAQKKSRESKELSHSLKPVASRGTSMPMVETKLTAITEAKTPKADSRPFQKPEVKLAAPTPIAKRTRQRVKV